jgi:hypothetical protein
MIGGMSGGLGAAIERLYERFERYPLDSPAPCAHCCPADEILRIERRLRKLPLREVGLDEIHRFYAEGVLTWGGVDDFRHLLPRLMELFAAYHLGEDVAWSGDSVDLRLSMGPDLALLRFTDAEWESWPEPEREAVTDFMLELWRAWLAGGANESLAAGEWFQEDLPEAILRLVPDPDPFLAHWRSADWPGLRHLAWFIANDHPASWLTWMDEAHPASVYNWYVVRNWLDGPETAARLETAARSSAPRAKAWEALLALEVLERGRIGVEFSGGSWMPDERSRVRARELGVMLPGAAG